MPASDGMPEGIEFQRLADRVRYTVPPPDREWPSLISVLVMIGAPIGLAVCLYVLWFVDSGSKIAAAAGVALVFICIYAAFTAWEIFFELWAPRWVVEVTDRHLAAGLRRGWLRWMTTRRLTEVREIHLENRLPPYGEVNQLIVDASRLDEETRRRAAWVYNVEARDAVKPLELIALEYVQARSFAEHLQAQLAERGVETVLTEAENRWVDPTTGRERSTIEQQPPESVWAVEAEGDRLTLVADKAKWVGTGNDSVLLLPSLLVMGAGLAWNFYVRDRRSLALSIWTVVIAVLLPFLLAGIIRLIRPKRRIRIRVDPSTLRIEEPGFLEFPRQQSWPVDSLVDVEAKEHAERGRNYWYLRIQSDRKVHRAVRLKNTADVIWAAAVVREACGLATMADADGESAIRSGSPAASR